MLNVNAALQRLRHVTRGVRAIHHADPTEVRTFEPVGAGGGAFGEWTLDAQGLPAFRYRLDQYQDACAHYPNSENLNRRDHWHQLGNDRITALASNDGIIQLYLADRGGLFANRFEARDYETQTHPATHSVARPFLNRVSKAFSAVLLTLGHAVRAVRSSMRMVWHRLRAARIVRQRPPAHALTPRGSAGAVPLKRRELKQFAHSMPPHTYGGGFGYVDDGSAVWATAHRYRPQGCTVERVFGMGYAQTVTTHRNVEVTRRVYAPCGDDALLLAEVQLRNLSPAPVQLRYYEYWDVNIHRLKLQWLRSGVIAALGDEERRACNDDFAPAIAWDAQQRVLRFTQTPRPGVELPPADAISDVDAWPLDVFLADLNLSRSAAHYTHKAAFFGAGGARQPDAVRARREGDEGALRSADPMPYCLVLRHDVTLDPGASVTLRYAYGVTRPGQELSVLARYRDTNMARALQAWPEWLAYFKAESESVLQREMAWHAYNLLSATVYNEYYGAHLTPQGSAYLYLHGADGAPRDQALFALPLTYLRPDLVRDTLRLIMGMTHADTGAIPYAFSGHGFHSDGLGIHAQPSDLDLFFLLALSEYLAATGDSAFFDAEVPFYPHHAPPASALSETVLDHVRVAVLHLCETIGVGEHGLLKIGDGDWSDAIVFETALRDGPLGVNFENSKHGGESVPNTQMALYVLPLIAAQVESRDAALAVRMRALLPGLEKAVILQWNGRWFNRAVLRDFGDKPVLVGEEWINLEAQPWALISGLAARMGRQGVESVLIDSITRLLDDPSPIGATLTESGMVWPAVSQLLTWGYTRCRPDLAWRSLQRHTFATRAHAFPDKWFSVWSGPDGVNGADMPDPGGTWCSPATPMTDFPVMNANQDAMALLALLRVCGVEPAPGGDGLLIAPHVPKAFVLDVPLLRLDVSAGRISGEYRAVVEGRCVLHVRPPTANASATHMRATVNGAAVSTDQLEPNGIALLLTFKTGQRVPFEVRWE
jgi:hypothetical protein